MRTYDFAYLRMVRAPCRSVREAEAVPPHPNNFNPCSSVVTARQIRALRPSTPPSSHFHRTLPADPAPITTHGKLHRPPLFPLRGPPIATARSLARWDLKKRLAGIQADRRCISTGLRTTSNRHAASSFSMPAMSPTMTEGGITSWNVKEGVFTRSR